MINTGNSGSQAGSNGTEGQNSTSDSAPNGNVDNPGKGGSGGSDNSPVKPGSGNTGKGDQGGEQKEDDTRNGHAGGNGTGSGGDGHASGGNAGNGGNAADKPGGADNGTVEPTPGNGDNTGKEGTDNSGNAPVKPDNGNTNNGGNAGDSSNPVTPPDVQTPPSTPPVVNKASVSDLCKTTLANFSALTAGQDKGAMPNTPRPAMGVATEDPTYHSCVTRLTDNAEKHPVQPLRVGDGTRLAPNAQQAFNANDSAFLLRTQNGEWHIYSPQTGKAIRKLTRIAGDAEPQWDPKDLVIPHIFDHMDIPRTMSSSRRIPFQITSFPGGLSFFLAR